MTTLRAVRLAARVASSAHARRIAAARGSARCAGSPRRTGRRAARSHAVGEAVAVEQRRHEAERHLGEEARKRSRRQCATDVEARGRGAAPPYAREITRSSAKVTTSAPAPSGASVMPSRAAAGARREAESAITMARSREVAAREARSANLPSPRSPSTPRSVLMPSYSQLSSDDENVSPAPRAAGAASRRRRAAAGRRVAGRRRRGRRRQSRFAP